MTDSREALPACFGRLEVVFPLGDDGLRHTPDSCMICCRYKTECLKTAMQGAQGVQVKEEVVDRAYESGAIGFLERWSKKKSLNNKKKNCKKLAQTRSGA